MNPHSAKAPDLERERQRHIEELIAEHGPQWSEPYKPGSFGCHELLDRPSMAGDIVRTIRSLPSSLCSEPRLVCLGRPSRRRLARALSADR